VTTGVGATDLRPISNRRATGLRKDGVGVQNRVRGMGRRVPSTRFPPAHDVQKLEKRRVQCDNLRKGKGEARSARKIGIMNVEA